MPTWRYKYIKGQEKIGGPWPGLKSKREDEQKKKERGPLVRNYYPDMQTLLYSASIMPACIYICAHTIEMQLSATAERAHSAVGDSIAGAGLLYSRARTTRYIVYMRRHTRFFSSTIYYTYVQRKSGRQTNEYPTHTHTNNSQFSHLPKSRIHLTSACTFYTVMCTVHTHTHAIFRHV